jgi:tRNA threonylcarbamoyladenosine biosynthesis protein TsaB
MNKLVEMKAPLERFDMSMITLALDTSESRGSVAVRRDAQTVAVRLHQGTADYSSWLLGAAEEVLREAASTMESVELLAVATGPGSFTGVRVGLTTVKAWAEVYGKRIVGVSRLESMAGAGEQSGLVAASYDAQRGQIFGGLYRWVEGTAKAVESEMVTAPGAFVAFVEEQAEAEPVQWVALDPQLITSTADWRVRERRGDLLIPCPLDVASFIGELAEERARRGEFTDALELDANYVRRSDAEILWKGPASGVR